MKTEPKCSICSVGLERTDETYTIDEIFRLWKPIEFSQKTIEEHHKVAELTTLHRCPQCHLEAFIPQIMGSPNFYVEAYNLENTQGSSAFGYSEDKWDFDQALSDAKGCSNVFEFGCGKGNFLRRAITVAENVAGLEYNDAAIAAARARGFDVFTSETQPGTIGDSWDAAFAFHVLEHVKNPVSLVESMVEILKPGGLIGISVPNQRGPIKYIKPCVMNMPPHHATRWELSAFQALAKRLDLQILRVAYEPLLLENHSYYSIYWVESFLRGESRVIKMFRCVISIFLRSFFGTMHRLNIRYFSMLKGLSIYVLMQKKQKTTGSVSDLKPAFARN